MGGAIGGVCLSTFSDVDVLFPPARKKRLIVARLTTVEYCPWMAARTQWTSCTRERRIQQARAAVSRRSAAGSRRSAAGSRQARWRRRWQQASERLLGLALGVPLAASKLGGAAAGSKQANACLVLLSHGAVVTIAGMAGVPHDSRLLPVGAHCAIFAARPLSQPARHMNTPRRQRAGTIWAAAAIRAIPPARRRVRRSAGVGFRGDGGRLRTPQTGRARLRSRHGSANCVDP